MDFVIARDEGIMSIDNQPLAIDTSALASNIALVAYDCSGGKGNIEYENSLRVLAPFIDVLPYAAFPNTWLTAAAALVGMPVTLAQAKRVKIGLVDGIFNSKRQLPISYAGNMWDATDQAMIGMQAAINSWNIAADISAADKALADNVNTMGLQVHMSNPASAPVAFIASTDTVSAATTATLDNTGKWVVGMSTSPAWATAVGGGTVGVQPAYFATKGQITSSPTNGPNVPWPPLNATAPVTLSMGQMRTLISNIQTRRAALQSTRLTKTNAVNLLTTIAAVIAYDATAGWPSS
jgi:hypothetical protein